MPKEMSCFQSKMMCVVYGGVPTARSTEDEEALNIMYNQQPHAVNVLIQEPIMPSTEEYWCAIEAVICEQLYNKEKF